ncbi:MAG: hypothetical protein JJ971_12465 [Balneolaceae bacterium]|nr:hypothetical protein [Balneolaceae bacterium]MBO6547335.1 hypothetical protein [Balneolaceae bacterium]MBO6647718.1 hypothetical protein [Balneolaceae bacterium]
MAHKGNFKNHPLKNDLDSEFDLDGYLDEKAHHPELEEQEEIVSEERSDLIKNSLLVVAVITTIFLWTFDWSPRNAYNYFFEGENQVFVVEEGSQTVIPDVTPTVAEAPQFPEFETAVEPSEGSSAVDYIVELREKNLLGEGKLSPFDARQLYSSGVPVSYIEALDGANLLGNFSFVDISEFYDSRIPIEYLEALEQSGYLNNLSFVDITEFYENNVPFEYLNQLNEIGILDELSFVDITEFYSANVSIDYLKQLEENDYIGTLSFVDITEFYENGVTVEFLNELKSKGLINELSFVDIVDLYAAEGN